MYVHLHPLNLTCGLLGVSESLLAAEVDVGVSVVVSCLANFLARFSARLLGGGVFATIVLSIFLLPFLPTPMGGCIAGGAGVGGGAIL